MQNLIHISIFPTRKNYGFFQFHKWVQDSLSYKTKSLYFWGLKPASIPGRQLRLEGRWPWWSDSFGVKSSFTYSLSTLDKSLPLSFHFLIYKQSTVILIACVIKNLRKSAHQGNVASTSETCEGCLTQYMSPGHLRKQNTENLHFESHC